MLDEIPVVEQKVLKIDDYSKIVLYTDGLSDLKGEDGKEILTKEIVKHLTNNDPVEGNIIKMLRKLGIPDENPDLFDDVSILAADLRR